MQIFLVALQILLVVLQILLIVLQIILVVLQKLLVVLQLRGCGCIAGLNPEILLIVLQIPWLTLVLNVSLFDGGGDNSFAPFELIKPRSATKSHVRCSSKLPPAGIGNSPLQLLARLLSSGDEFDGDILREAKLLSTITMGGGVGLKANWHCEFLASESLALASQLLSFVLSKSKDIRLAGLNIELDRRFRLFRLLHEPAFLERLPECMLSLLLPCSIENLSSHSDRIRLFFFVSWVICSSSCVNSFGFIKNRFLVTSCDKGVRFPGGLSISYSTADGKPN